MKSWLRVVQKQIYTKCRKSISYSNLQKNSKFIYSHTVKMLRQLSCNKQLLTPMARVLVETGGNEEHEKGAHSST